MIQEYEYVYEVYKEKSFTKAAKNLFISQPSLSATIRKIEERLGFKIFDRSKASLALTEEGVYYIETAKKILSAERDLQTYIDDLYQLQTGKITIAGSAFFSSCVIPYIVKTFSELYPKISLNFFEADSLVLYEEALKDQVDLIIDAGSYDKKLFETRFLFNESILLAVPLTNPIFLHSDLSNTALTHEDILKGHHLSDECPCVCMDIFKNEDFILLKNGHDLYYKAISLCNEYNFVPKCSIHLNQLMTAFHVASKCLGITLVTDTLIKHSYTNAPLAYFKINSANPELTSRKVFVAYRKGCHITHAMRSFITTCEKIRIFD